MVAVVSFWYPLNFLSLILAIASLALSIFNWEECEMSKKLDMVSLGINGAEGPGLGLTSEGQHFSAMRL